MHNPIYRKQIDRKLAWHGSDFRSKDDIAFDLTVRHVAALEEVLGRVAKIPRDEIRREDCAHPALDTDLSSVLDEIQFRRGLVLVRGFPVVNHALEDIEKMYWIFANHMGLPLSQDSLGHRMIRVQEEVLPGGVRTIRGSKTRQELAMHWDNSEIFALLCVRQAKEGGETHFSSSLAVHNEILANRPDLLPILYRGFPEYRRGEQPDHQPAVTPYDSPVFCNVDGVISCGYGRSTYLAGLHMLGRTPTEAELEALDYVMQTARRLQFNLRFEPGEISIANDFIIQHARSEYVDWDDPEKNRLLLRLWLEPTRDRRPILRELRFFENEGGRGGVDPVPGRKFAANGYKDNIPDDVMALVYKSQSATFASTDALQAGERARTH